MSISSFFFLVNLGLIALHFIKMSRTYFLTFSSVIFCSKFTRDLKYNRSLDSALSSSSSLICASVLNYSGLLGTIELSCDSRSNYEKLWSLSLSSDSSISFFFLFFLRADKASRIKFEFLLPYFMGGLIYLSFSRLRND